MLGATSIYSVGERNVAIVLVVCGLISLLALLVLFGRMAAAFVSGTRLYPHTHFQAYFVCLLVANAVQALGVIMGLKWVGLRVPGIVEGQFCALQGSLTLGGNIGTAVWSLCISLHLFNLLFLRHMSSPLVSRAIIVFGWSFIVSIVFLGPVALERPARGHYFGISGLACGITDRYRKEKIWLEYFIQALAVVLNLLLHTATLLRVRGNLLHVSVSVDGDGDAVSKAESGSDNKLGASKTKTEPKRRWRLRFVPSAERWQLALVRDFTDSTVLRLAQHMIWYPVAYAVTLFPLGFARFMEFCGMPVPLWADALVRCVYDLGGLLNTLLFFSVRRVFPDLDAAFTAPRKDLEGRVARSGVEPFVLTTRSSEATQ